MAWPAGRAEHKVTDVAAVAEQSSASAEEVSASTQADQRLRPEDRRLRPNALATADQLDALVRRVKTTA